MDRGDQWLSWIHLADLQKLIIESIENESYRGPLNATSPHPVRQKDFAQSLGRALRRPAWLPIPGFALRLILGEMADFLLASTKVMPHKLKQNGFIFDYADLNTALANILDAEGNGECDLVVHQFVPKTLDQVFPFYANEQNLETITPSFLNFKVLGKNTPTIKEGTKIDYKLSLHGIPFFWRTEIVSWKPPLLFIDIQLKGPYKKWHHTHRFESLGNGTLISDEIRYQVPFGFLGSLIAGRKVASDIKAIFAYRREVIAKKFENPSMEIVR